ncbi:uncharacterized protein BJ212DRAFT_1488223 [Suillus subaureus]|uniref:Uncharacterized protein n=1 Tax=Suillus subaureus TaxID=48587 RepID=A0A9P7DP51_9AGAM|nr:uncharacterized protein BJ212DRAFT_1488223 [Suillus subaureus]KAG1799655.1 hypothetical protein BJ212DRAFT_1488223 [Suillus subaureus]
MPREFVGQLNEQADEIEYQTGRIKDLEASHTRLEASNEEISATMQRRVARSASSFTMNELRPGGQGVVAAPALHDDALKMIFYSSRGTIRSESNAAAPNASKEDSLALAIKGPDLTASQAATLKDFDVFTHHDIPDF